MTRDKARTFVLTALTATMLAALVGCNLGAAPVYYSTGGGSPWRWVSGDLSSDGDLDFVVAFNGGYSVLLNDGTGTYEANVVEDPELSPFQDLALADLNADDNPDLVVLTDNSDDSPLYLLFGDEAGGFGAPVQFATAAPGPRLYGLGVADLDADGHADLVEVGTEIVLRLGDGAGGFASSNVLPTPGFEADSITFDDLNNDEHVDLVIPGGIGSCEPPPCNFEAGVAVMLGDGAGGFSAPVP